MAQDSKIEWCDHTRNFWSGCTEVSPACAHCYARAMSKRNRIYGQWGKGAPRAWHGDGAAKEIARWNRMAASCGTGHGASSCPVCSGPQGPRRPRVFINSMSDWLDDEVPVEWLAKLLDSIRLAPNLDFLLLTKRPENWRERMERALCHAEGLDYEDKNWVNVPGPDTDLGDFINQWTGDNPPPNIWIGTTAENQEWADKRREHLRAIPAVCHFVSYEPALGPIDWTGWDFLKWLISGGESGGKARPSHPWWHRAARDYAAKHGIAYLFKQWGEWVATDALLHSDPIRTEPCRGAAYVGHDGKVWPVSDAPCSTYLVRHVGKAKSGRILDGVEHNGFPSI